MSDVRAYRAALVHCLDDPRRAGPDAVAYHPDGLLLVENIAPQVPLTFDIDPEKLECRAPDTDKLTELYQIGRAHV